MTITMNLTDTQVKSVLISAEEKGISIDELIQSIIDEHFPNEIKTDKDQKWEKFLHAINGFTEDCFENFENERLIEIPDKRESFD